jgi:hypothetical protein
LPERFVYRLCGVAIESALELPGLPPGGQDSLADVTIAFGPFATALPEATAATPLFQLGPLALQLAIPDVATYRVTGGNRITIDPSPAAEARDIRVFLLGSAFGALWLQRSLLPLHASAVAIGMGCVAFAGPSGVGKSTLAAFMAGRGHGLVSDDVCVVDSAVDGAPIAWPGPPRLKLWRDALDGLAIRSTPGSAVRRDLEKFEVPPPAGAAQGPLPLMAVYIVERPGVVGSPRRLRGLDAVDALTGATYRAEYTAGMGVQERQFRACAGLVAGTPIIRVGRPWDFASLEAFARSVEDEVR